MHLVSSSHAHARRSQAPRQRNEEPRRTVIRKSSDPARQPGRNSGAGTPGGAWFRGLGNAVPRLRHQPAGYHSCCQRLPQPGAALLGNTVGSETPWTTTRNAAGPPGPRRRRQRAAAVGRFARFPPRPHREARGAAPRGGSAARSPHAEHGLAHAWSIGRALSGSRASTFGPPLPLSRPIKSI
jgi:hypothetical protein